MTTLLETAFEKASTLSEIEQNRVARFLIEEIRSEQKWNALFAESEDELAQIADAVLEDYTAGQTTPLTPERL